jgi:hypothetical protein
MEKHVAGRENQVTKYSSWRPQPYTIGVFMVPTPRTGNVPENFFLVTIVPPHGLCTLWVCAELEGYERPLKKSAPT